MGDGIVRSISFLLLIIVGILLKSKFSEDQRSGIKQIILSLALPAVIFIALQGVEFSLELILFPMFALLCNVALYFGSFWLLPRINQKNGTPIHRTISLLVPSLAPGLSCFPFILEFLGDAALAKAAFADVGNKLFVLVVLYAVAMRWHYQSYGLSGRSRRMRLKKFVWVMIKEPVNLAIIFALMLVALGWRYTDLPEYIVMTIDKIGGLMAPLILIYIGLSIKLTWSMANRILLVLLGRSAVAFILSALVIFTFGLSDHMLIMLVILLPQSSISFWPLMHIELVSRMEGDSSSGQNTFDKDFALNLVAMSLPFSTVIILSLCTLPSTHTTALVSLGLGLLLIGLSLIVLLITRSSLRTKINLLIRSEANS